MREEIPEIIEAITERFDSPVNIGSRCIANVYYRVEDLTDSEVSVFAEQLGRQVVDTCYPNLPQLIIRMPGTYTGLAQRLGEELAPSGEAIEVLDYNKIDPTNGSGAKLRGKTLIIVTDVITTARSCLEAHGRTTLLGANVICWVSIIDRTFGPGPVPVVAAWTGEPVTLLP